MEKGVLTGYKTYIVGGLLSVTGIYLMAKGGAEQGWQVLLTGLGIMGLRKGVENSLKEEE